MTKTLKARDTVIRVAQYEGSGPDVEYRIEGIPGLVLAVLAPRRNGTNRKVWRVRFSHTANGKRTQRKKSIGSYPTITLAMARKSAADIMSQAEQGVDVVAAEAKRRREQAAATATFADFFKAYFAARTGEIKTLDQIEGTLRRNALPVLGDKAVQDITRQDIEDALEPSRAAGKLTTARRTLSYLRTMFNYAMTVNPGLGERFGVTEDPTRTVGRRPRGSAGRYGRDQTGQRALDDAEIAQVLAVLDSDAHDTSPAVRRILRLLLLTGQRSSEVRELPIEELRLGGREPLWSLPGSRVKNGLDHIVPLAPAVVEILRKQIGARKTGPVFPSTSERSTFINKWALGTAVNRLFSGGHLDMPKWSPHDLRRTVETGMARLGIAREIRDRALNHIDQSVGARFYNVHEYRDELRQALTQWADHVAALRTRG